MASRIKTKKWILYRHTKDFDLIKCLAINLKQKSNSISKEAKQNLLNILKDHGYYKERNPNKPLDSINHRINTLAYFMFGYKDHDQFLFSPLGNLFLKNLDDQTKIGKIFLTMLWSMQFEHPHSRTDKEFKIYPFRLIFKLLMDKRLGMVLYAYEVTYHIVFTQTINPSSYEILIEKILDMRKWSTAQIEKKFKEDMHAYVNAAYEWDYYVSDILVAAGILEKQKGEFICSLAHGKSSKRKLQKNFVKLSEPIINYCSKLLKNFPYDDKPLELNDPERLRIDVIKEIYSFYPKILLEEISDKAVDLKYELLNLAKLIDQYSNNTDGIEAYLFEDTLVKGFELFVNLKVSKVGGSGKTDIECLYIPKKEKFTVDAKSTKNKLSSINAGRLAHHRLNIGGKYTIVITSRYSPAVLVDIKGAPIVIILASTFSEYLYNHIDNDIREIDYADFDQIIKNNQGTDISDAISKLTLDKFSVKS